jgi:capsular exopolysaccharide synthesis family protein
MMALQPTEMLALAGPRGPDVRSAPAQDPLSFGALFEVLRRRYRLFGAVVLLTLAASLVAALMLPAWYEAKATLMIDPRPHASSIRNESKGFPAPDATLVDTEVQVMTSPSILGAVIDRLKLARDPEFAPAPGEGGGLDAVAETLSRQVKVGREGLTYIVAIRAQSRDPNKAAAIANTMAEQYLRQSRSQRARLAADQARTLTAELGPLGQQVIAADQAVADFRAANGIVSGGGDDGTVTDQQVGTIASELGRASADAAAARAAASAARAQVRNAGVDAVSQVLNSGSLTELRNQRAQVLREQGQIATIYSPDHPASRRIGKQLAQLDREIEVSANRIVLGLENDARASEARVATLRGQLSALAARQSQDARTMVVADGLERNADAKRNTFNDLSRNAQEQAQAARIGDVRAWRVAAARPPLEPNFPKMSLFLVAGLVLGTALGAGAVVGAELMATGYRSAAEIEADLGLPFLAGAPEVSGRLKARLRRRRSRCLADYVVAKPASAFAESMRNVRATLLADADGGRPRTICITSALTGEGKSAIAVALARIMAMSGDRVLLIDCDLRRGGLGGLGALPAGAPRDRPSAGVVEVLDGEADADAAVVQDTVPGLAVLGLDAPVVTSRDVFSGKAAQELMARLKAEYDFVILDAPPVLAVTDAWTLSSICDATVLVVRHLRTPRAAVRAARDRLLRRGAKLHGVVLNRRAAGNGVGSVDYYDSLYAYHDN